MCVCVSFVMCRFGADAINIHVAVATEAESLATDHHSAGPNTKQVLLKRVIEPQQTLVRSNVARW